jgi:uncharacterized protein YgbK (DUF1537 family)
MCLVVFDDDPTGTQTVHGVDVLTTWDHTSLARALAGDEPAFYVLTNSRALTAAASEALHEEIMQNLLRASRETGKDVTVISRSDSTLRGHYPLEMDVIREKLEAEGRSVDAELIVPFFAEGGRITHDDIHYVQQNGCDVPAGETEFARDATFGYSASDLKEWIQEKSEGKYSAGDVWSISLERIRSGGASQVESMLMDATKGRKVIVNATRYDDLQVVVRAIHAAQRKGKLFTFRTAASFVRVMAGISPRPLLTSNELISARPQQGGLVVVGSHVKKSSDQLQALLEYGTTATEVPVSAIVQDDAKDLVQRIANEVDSALSAGETVVVYTSRGLFRSTQDTSEANLSVSARVSGALVDIVRSIRTPPAWILAKGGITSSDLATKGLGVKRARVLGQVLPGVPVWRLGAESRFPDIPYIVFPGNVGDEHALKSVVETITETARSIL